MTAKANIIMAASGLAHFPVPLGQRVFECRVGRWGQSPPSLIYSCFLQEVTNSSTQNCLPSQATGCNSSHISLEKRRQIFFKRKLSCRMQAKVPRYPNCWFSYQRTEINHQVLNKPDKCMEEKSSSGAAPRAFRQCQLRVKSAKPNSLRSSTNIIRFMWNSRTDCRQTFEAHYFY